jgi:hypothetical protein
MGVFVFRILIFRDLGRILCVLFWKRTSEGAMAYHFGRQQDDNGVLVGALCLAGSVNRGLPDTKDNERSLAIDPPRLERTTWERLSFFDSGRPT